MQQIPSVSLVCLTLFGFAAVGCDKQAGNASPSAASPSGSAAATSAIAASPTGPTPVTPAATDTLLSVGSDAPAIEALAHNGESVKLTDLRGKVVIVYFYPKDDTPGCTVEAKGIRDEWSGFKSANAVVLGVSSDDNDSHKAFATKYELPFLLLPDPKHEIAAAFKVPVQRGYAKRVTFVIDKAGKIAKVFPEVTPSEHSKELLQAIDALKG